MGSQALEVEARAELLDSTQKDDAALYLATYENKLSNRVTAGEPRPQAGARLCRPGVAGPFAFSRDAQLLEQRVLRCCRAVPRTREWSDSCKTAAPRSAAA